MTFSQPGDDPRFKTKHYRTLHKMPFPSAFEEKKNVSIKSPVSAPALITHTLSHPRKVI